MTEEVSPKWEKKLKRMHEKVDLSEYSFDFGGHDKGPVEPTKFNDLDRHIKFVIKRYIEEEIRFSTLFRDQDDDDASQRPYISLARVPNCENCNRGYEMHVGEDKIVRIVDDKCQFPNGMPEFTVEINIPSGKIVFGNDFRDLVALNALNDSYNVNSNFEQKRYTEDNADAGLVLICVGNTCPSVFRKDDTLLVMNAGYDEETDDEKEISSCEKLGGICTDLWWYSAMDYDHYVAAMTKNGEDISFTENDYEFVVDVKPGRYEFSSRGHLIDRDSDDECLFSVIRRIGDCVDVPSKHEGVKTGDQFFDSRFWRSWEHDKTKSWRGFSSILGWGAQMFCASGYGYHWHYGILCQEGRSGKPWSDLEKYNGIYEDGKKPLRQGTAIYNQIPQVPLTGVEQFRKSDQVYIHGMDADYIQLTEAPVDADIYYVAFGLILFKMLYEHPELLENSSGRKVGDDLYGTELDPEKPGFLKKIGVYTEQDVIDANMKKFEEQWQIVNGTLDLLMDLICETDRYSELLSAFSAFERDSVMKEMG